MSKTDAFEVEVLKLCTGQTTSIYTTTAIPPYIALYSVTPSDSAAGTEITGNNYARQSAAFAAPSAANPSTVANNGTIVFPTATPAGYTVSACGLVTAVSAGSLLRWQDITDIVLGINDQANFAIGAISFTED